VAALSAANGSELVENVAPAYSWLSGLNEAALQDLMMTNIFNKRGGMQIPFQPKLEFNWPKQPFLIPSAIMSSQAGRDRSGQYVGGFDPFSSLPEVALPWSIQTALIQYCKHPVSFLWLKYCDIEEAD
jgi:hypothetical protein